MAEQADTQDRKSGWLVFWSFLAFFVTFVSVDIYFVIKALSTHTGVVTEHAYEKGLAYDQALAQARAQASLQADLRYEDGLVKFSLHDKDGQALDPVQVRAYFMRTVQKGHDFDLPLIARGEGVYEAQAEFPLKGAWIIKVEAQWPAQDKRQNKTQNDPQNVQPLQRYQTQMPIRVR